jgi:hypothetical protein
VHGRARSVLIGDEVGDQRRGEEVVDRGAALGAEDDRALVTAARRVVVGHAGRGVGKRRGFSNAMWVVAAIALLFAVITFVRARELGAAGNSADHA